MMIVMALALSLQDAAPDKGPCVLPEATQQGTPEAGACDAAIAAGDRTTKARLLYYRGYARNEGRDSLAALVDLDIDARNVDVDALFLRLPTAACQAKARDRQGQN